MINRNVILSHILPLTYGRVTLSKAEAFNFIIKRRMKMASKRYAEVDKTDVLHVLVLL